MNSDDLRKVVQELQDDLIARCTGGFADDARYIRNRTLLLSRARKKSLVPEFVRRCRSLHHFWEFIKSEFPSYAERRTFLWDSFSPLLDDLEFAENSPHADVVHETLKVLDAKHVEAVWERALERLSGDAEGAITSARTLLETVCKLVLDDLKVEYSESDNLPKLYGTVAKELKLAPAQHSEEVFKQILGGCHSVVQGLGTLRSRIGDAHGGGRRRVAPASRHAELAVNLAGAMATFLVQTALEARND